MTYNEIMSKAGRKIDPKVTYYNENTQVVVSNDDYISGKPKFETGLIGTIMKGLELELKVLIPSNTINFENKASYENESVTKNYGEYNLKETPTFNADTQTYTYQFYDNFLKFMIPYKPIEISYPCSVLDFTKKLIQTLGFTCNITYLPNGTNTIASDIYKDINMTYRDVLEDIGKATFTLFEMDNKEVKVCNFKEDEVIIDDDLLMNKNIAFDKKNGAFNTIILSRSADSDNLSKSNPADLADDLKVAYKISDCQMLNDNNRGDFIDDILNELYGIEYYVYDTQLVGYGGFKPLQKVKFVTGGNTYVSYVMSNEEIITQGYEEHINAPELTGVEQDYKTTDIDDRRLQSVSLIVDKQGKTITAQAKDIGELNSKTTQLRLDVDKIEGEISDIADITVTSEGTGTIEVLNVAGDSEPIYLKVRPTIKNLALLYPADNLYPSDDLYPLERYLLFKNGSYEQKYRLPADLWYYNSTTYDEFVLDYNNQRSYVIHRVGVNADGTTYVLDSVTEEDFTYPNIPLAEGDYQISLEGHETAYIYARLMANSIYTNQFATKVELNSKITQVNNEIDLSVSQLATNFDKEVENLQGEINVQAGKVVLKADTNGNIVKAELTADPAEGTAFNVKADNINFSGKNFNLTSDNMSITSTNFSVDKNGKVTAKEAEITGGNIRLASSGNVAKIILTDSNDNSQTLQMSPRTIRWMKGTNVLMTSSVVGNSPVLGLNSATTSEAVNINPYYMTYKNSSNEETIRLSGSSGNISCVSLTQTSLEKHKMNIEKYTGALKEIEKIDIYKYNLKVENKDTKKHIGFIIGDKYRYSKEITNNEDNGVELYSMTSLCLQAIKEQQEIINKLQERVSFLEKQKNMI